ncbi:Npt1/Npt2 family nucleotide transporter [Paludibaculum fermentans]|uniref:ADP,ATP carrier protein n=1 Tax=Paludibaculum fermentans TaxID=1473598 RepID=A0A7S7SJ62_PALFE|nr:Npt1/Npt2 family nucleotide transporter [Paludibaculum fermentans]QOY86363.1 cyclic nucleotide-binding domain-containing protein [Paludibaculum fermentans]
MLKRLQARLSRAIDVRPGEYARTALMFLYLMCVLLAYYILKPSSRALFLTRFTTDHLPYLYMVMAVSGGILAYFYSRIAVKWSLNAAVNASIVFVVLCLLELWQLLDTGQSWVYYVFNVWVSLFSLVLVSQGWLVASQVFDAREAKRVYGILAGGAVLGAAIGGSLTAQFAAAVGTRNLLMVSAAFVVLAYVFYRLLLLQPGVNLERARGASREEIEFSVRDIGQAVLQRRHLQVIVAILTVTYVVDTLVEFQFNSMAVRGRSGDQLTAFLGGFYGLYLNLATFFLQIFLTSWIVNRFGVGGTLLAMPIGIGCASGAMLFSPGVWAAGAARLIEASTRYSLNRTGMELLYLPLPDDLKQRTKAFVDVFVDRMARGLGALVILGLGALFTDSLTAVTVAVLVLCCVWVALSLYARREYIATVRGRLESRRLDLESMRIPYQDAGLLRLLEETARKQSPRQAVYALAMLDEVPDYPLEPFAVRMVHQAPSEVRAKIFEIAALRGWHSLLSEARAEIEQPGSVALKSAVRYACSVNGREDELLVRMLDSKDPKLVEAAVESSTSTPLSWVKSALESSDPARRRLGALALRAHPKYALAELPRMLADGDSRVRGAAADTLVGLGEDVAPVLAPIVADEAALSRLRLRALRVLTRTQTQAALDSLMGLLSVEDLVVRSGVVRALTTLRDRSPQLRFGGQPVEEQIQLEARSYYAMHAALGALRQSGRKAPALALLMRTLEERMGRTVERLFRLLGLRYPPKDIDAAFRAYQRNKQEELSNAIDFLDNILDHELKRLVLPLLDEDGTDDQALLLFGIDRPTAGDALGRMIDEGDPWLMGCALAAARDLGLNSGVLGRPETMRQLNIVERVIALEGVDLMKGLTPDQLSRVAAIATQDSAQPGRDILTPQSPLDAMYIILDGSVALLQDGEQLEVVHQNEVLGSWALLDNSPLPVTARALEDTVLLRISRDDFFDLLSDNMEIASAILSTLVKRFRALLSGEVKQ